MVMVEAKRNGEHQIFIKALRVNEANSTFKPYDSEQKQDWSAGWVRVN
jgi:hypothetical protein